MISSIDTLSNIQDSPNSNNLNSKEMTFAQEEEFLSISSSSYENITDYTSRILSLNENSKLNLMTFLEQYKEENTNLNKDVANKVVMNYLSQVLNDSNNYNHASYYA